MTALNIEQFNIEQLANRENDVAIVTGANTGIGYETTKLLALKGLHVVMACRNGQKALAAKSQILSEVSGAKLDYINLDLTSLASVRTFSDTFTKKYHKLDLLINNAGTLASYYQQTEDGFELQMGANYFGHFLLTSLLLELIPNAPSSRIVTISSLAHAKRKKRIFFEDIHCQKNYNNLHAYSQSKLACLMFALELQQRLSDSGRQCLSVAAHPGISTSELFNSLPAWQMTIMRYTLLPIFAHSSAQGALSSIVAALAPNIQGSDYIGPDGFKEMTGLPSYANIKPWAKNPEHNKRLWDLSVKLTGATFPLTNNMAL